MNPLYAALSDCNIKALSFNRSMRNVVLSTDKHMAILKKLNIKAWGIAYVLPIILLGQCPQIIG